MKNWESEIAFVETAGAPVSWLCMRVFSPLLAWQYARDLDLDFDSYSRTVLDP